MKANVRFEMWDVVSRLDQLGLKIGPVREAVRRGQLAAASCTGNHPPLMRGIVRWGETVCALREHLAPYGWMGSDEGNYSLVLDPKGQIAVAVATGDESTGKRDAFPCNSSPKGLQTAIAVSWNQFSRNLDLFEDLPTPTLAPPVAAPEGRATWILLMFRANNEVRCELSLPDQITEDGHIAGWSERIILDAIPLDGDPIEMQMPAQPDIDIAVRRRAS